MYGVVQFRAENSVESIPMKWLSEDKRSCFWPEALKMAALKKAIKQCQEPCKNWKLFEVTVLGEGYGKQILQS